MQGHSPDIPDDSKNALSPVEIPLKRKGAPQKICNKPGPLRRVKDLRLEEYASLGHMTRMLGFPCTHISQP